MALRVALIGASKGPWVDISRISRPQLQVTGLPAGATLTVTFMDPKSQLTVSENGLFPAPRSAWAQIDCDAPGRHKTICMFSREAA